MKALVTGATGFIGRRLVQRLLDGGHSVSILTRRPAAISDRRDGRIRIFGGDLRTDRLELPDDVECVFHCAGTLGNSDAHDVNVDGTRRVVEFAVGTSAVRRLVYLSSVGVIGPTGPGVVNETAACAPSNAYESSKLEAEHLVLASNGCDLVSTALRPSIVFGYRSPATPDSFRQLAESMVSGRFRLIGSGSGYYNLAYVEDVAAALVTLLDAAAATCGGKAFILNDPIRWDAFAELVSDLTNAPVAKPISPIVALPVAMAGTVATALGISFPLTLSRYRAMTSKTQFSSELLEQELGFRFPYGTRAGIDLTIARYSAEDPRIRGILRR